MTEAEWLECDKPERMLTYLRGRASERKLRLFAVAAARLASRWFVHAFHGVVLDVGEQVAEGVYGSEALDETRTSAWDSFRLGLAGYGDHHILATRAAARTVESEGYRAADLTKNEIVGLFAEMAQEEGVSDEQRQRLYFAGRRRAEAQLARLLREVFGNPYRAVSLPSAVLAWQNATVPRVARAAYDGRHLPEGTLDPTRLALFADALEDAGCTHVDVLGHLRGQGPHVRGCWALDLALAKS
jgi:hypothetical protein